MLSISLTDGLITTWESRSQNSNYEAKTREIRVIGDYSPFPRYMSVTNTKVAE